MRPWRTIVHLLAFAVVLPFTLLALSGCPPQSRDWENFNVLAQRPPGPVLPQYNGKPIPYDEYLQWVEWGEEWFRSATFGNERFLTDISGFLHAPVDVPDGQGGWRTERFFKYFVQALDHLDGVRGNLYQGNGNGYTHDLVIAFPPGSKLHKDFPLPERLHTGLDVEAGATWPVGIVPKPAPPEEAHLPYLLDPSQYAEGPEGIGPVPGQTKYRAGMACAICHYSLDVDWDGKTDLRSARLREPTPGSLYKPQDAWAIGNQDLHLGWVFMSAENAVAAIFASGRVGKLSARDAKAWLEDIVTQEDIPPAFLHEIIQGVLMMPRGYFDDTPDAIHNPLQYPVLFTRDNWPYNYDGVMLNASDRNNNVWTVSFDPSQLAALAKNRLGRTSQLLFWREADIFSAMTAEEYADLLVRYAPAVRYDPTQRQKLRDDILGTSDGVPGVLRNDAMVLITEAWGAFTDDILKHPDNATYHRLRKAKEFGPDGKYRGQMTGMLGTRVITPPEIREQFNVAALEKKYGLNGDEFVSQAVNIMLDWVEPPANRSALLARAQLAGLVPKGYVIFRQQGCATCHAGPFFTDNRILPLQEIGTNHSRTMATEPLQTFVAPEYDPATGLAISQGVFGFIGKLFGSKQHFGYKVVTLRYLWGSAPYLHDGGVGVALRPGSTAAGDDLQALLRRPEEDKLYGMGQILAYREDNSESYLRPNAALSLQALLLKSERDKVLVANRQPDYPIPASTARTSMAFMNIQGIGHTYWIDDTPGGDTITALVAFLLALDDDPGK